jgi:PAS domain-containing protein
VIETSGFKHAKAEIKRLHEELAQHVIERTQQLTAVNEELSREILERKRAEEQLRKSEERWRAVFENSAVGIAMTGGRDHDGAQCAKSHRYMATRSKSSLASTALSRSSLIPQAIS